MFLFCPGPPEHPPYRRFVLVTTIKEVSRCSFVLASVGIYRICDSVCLLRILELSNGRC